MEKQLEQFLKASLAVKAAIVAGAIVLVTAANYFLYVADVEERIVYQHQQQRQLELTLAEKRDIAQNLNERRRELDQLEQKLSEALSELPEEADVDELLSQLSDIGRKAGLAISVVEPGRETVSGTIARIPVRMSVSGNYHEVALFLQEIANMRRIVNVNGIKLGAGKSRSDKLVLNSDFVATTFRFIKAEAPGGKVAGGVK